MGWAAWHHACVTTADKLTAAPGLLLEKRLELRVSSRSMIAQPLIPFLVLEFVAVLHQGSAVPRFPVLWYLFQTSQRKRAGLCSDNLRLRSYLSSLCLNVKISTRAASATVVVQLLSRVQLFCDPMDCSPPGSSVHGILGQEDWSG